MDQKLRHSPVGRGTKPSDAALVVGAGVAGVRAALDLAALGHRVHLAERSHRLGGLTSRLYRMYPKCFCCKVHPLLAEAARHPNIQLLCGATLADLAGQAGRFAATLTLRPAHLDPERCTSCGRCAGACPQGAIVREDPRDLPALWHLDGSRCLRSEGQDCRLCEEACPEGAVDLAAAPTTRRLSVGAVVLATGLEQVDPRVYDTFGYGELPGVVTSLEFERLLSLSARPMAGSCGPPTAGRSNASPGCSAWARASTAARTGPTAPRSAACTPSSRRAWP